MQPLPCRGGGGAAVIIIIIPSQSAGGGVIDSKDTVMLDSFICGCFNGCTKTAYEVCVARRRWLQDDEFEHHVRLSQVSATTWGSFYHSLRQLLAHLLATWIIALHHAGHFKTAIVSFPLFKSIVHQKIFFVMYYYFLGCIMTLNSDLKDFNVQTLCENWFWMSNKKREKLRN